MNLDYKNYIHPTFALNGQKLDFVSLVALSVKLLSSNQEHEILLGKLIEEWFNDQDYTTLTTSGTTGTPKLIKIKKDAMVQSAIASEKYFNIPGQARALHCLPVQYIAGKMMFIRAILLGWDLTYVAPNSSPLSNFNTRFNFVAMVPLQVENSLEKLHLIDTIIIGGAKVNTTLRQKLLGFKTKIYETYGMTETVTHIAAKLISEESFSALPNVEFFIDDRNCLGIHAPRVSDEDIQTNDIVSLNTKTSFKWLGRVDNVINSGGIKLFPEKIEEKLEPYINKRFFVGGIPDEKLGMKLVLIIEGENYSLDLKKIPTLSKFEIPKEIHFILQFLETDTSKIKRNEMLQMIV